MCNKFYVIYGDHYTVINQFIRLVFYSFVTVGITTFLQCWFYTDSRACTCRLYNSWLSIFLVADAGCDLL
ncbi:MAG: hypothetical protein ACI8RD_012323 [Bacillariaceae sp.]|jgi:hypothetical protein